MMCLAVVGVFIAERRWVRILSGLYLFVCGIAVVVQVIRDRWNPACLLVPSLLVLLGMYVHSVEHIFDPAEKPKEK